MLFLRYLSTFKFGNRKGDNIVNTRINLSSYFLKTSEEDTTIISKFVEII